MENMKNNTKLLTLGQNIKEIRKNLNLTQDEFSEKLDITSNFLSRVENGYVGISIDNVINICKLANCSPSSLFKGIIELPAIIDKYEQLNSANKLIIEKMIIYLLEAQ